MSHLVVCHCGSPENEGAAEIEAQNWFDLSNNN